MVNIFFNGLLVVFLKVVLMFLVVIFFFLMFIMSFMMDMLGVGMWSVMLLSLFLSWGSMSDMVLVVLVLVGIMFNVVVLVCFKFLCEVLSSFCS